MKRLLFVVLLLFLVMLTPQAFAQTNSYVSIVNPVRGNDFWDLKHQKPETAVLGQIAILDSYILPATWLLRFDVLDNPIVNELKKRSLDEKGLFLEITPTWTDEARVKYRRSSSWHAAGSAFLTGYERSEREKLIDKSFEKFQKVFGYFPKAVGAWWIDSYSLDYMQKKYGIISGLIVADQYTTDNYQIWGQYFSTPYYPDQTNALRPAQSLQNKIPIVLSQWAARDPINGYGNGVFESTFSVQPNDYIDYHELGIDYFSKLVSLYTNQKFNQFGAIVVGLENTYEWSKYKDEYRKQVAFLKQKNQAGLLQIVTLGDFAHWYQKAFPSLSPEQLIITDDPLGSYKKVVWFMNPYYRAGWFYNEDGSVFRDIRQYITGSEEICFQKSCSEVNFATFATRVLDEVTYGNKWVVDEGKIKNFNVAKESDGYSITYTNEAGNRRKIEFLPRDIQIDDKISTIDGAILNAIKPDKIVQQKNKEFNSGLFNWSITSIIIKSIMFLSFIIITCLIPGLVLIRNLVAKESTFLQRTFLSTVVGLVLLTLVFYVASLLNLRFLFLAYLLASILLFLRFKLFVLLKPNFKNTDKLSLVAFLVIVVGTIFQIIPTFRSGLTFVSGMGFWGPNTHDGIWHISLINQLIKGLPVENPVFSNTILKNYHFFYDLLVAATAYLTKIPVMDLIFRFYPVIFSLLLGIGTYYLVLKLFTSKIGFLKARVAAIFSLYFVYSAGSFGWIVEYLKYGTFGGESAFWANQSISFNLNPPFAISVLILITFLHFLLNKSKNFYWVLVTAMLAGSLMGFKAYAAVLILISLSFVSVINIFRKDFSYFVILIFSSVISILIFFSNFKSDQQLILFSPFWFIHSMIDSPDRVGWVRLSITRIAGLQTSNLFKVVYAEGISLLIFIMGNLGIRILSLFSLIKAKTIFQSNEKLFILIFSLLSFSIPILFIQSGNPWNTIQFSYYGLYLTGVISGAVLSSLVFSLPRLLSLVIVVPILMLTPINSVTTASYYFGRPHAIISIKELKGLEFLSRQMNGIVLTYPYNEKTKLRLAEPWPLYAYDSTAYAAALSGKSVYVEDEPQNQILLTDYKKRLVASNDFFINSDNQARKDFLSANKIKYIYLPKYFNISIDEPLLNLKTIFENEEVKIYQRT